MTWAPVTPSELLMYCVKRVECELSSGHTSVGTGYICAIENMHGNAVPVLITNKHVIEGAVLIRVCMHTAIESGNPSPDGGKVFIESPGVLTPIVNHPDDSIDLCAIILGPMINIWKMSNPGRTVFYKLLTDDLIFKPEYVEQLDVTESVLMVGCPNGIWDDHNGFPLFRRGTTASHPALDFKERPDFAIDIAVYSGSSGSPIFLADSGLVKTKKGGNEVVMQTRFGLLGTLWGGPRINEYGEIKIVPAPTSSKAAVETGVRMHLGYAIKGQQTSRLLKIVAEKYGSVGPTEFIYPDMMVPLTPEAFYKATGVKLPIP